MFRKILVPLDGSPVAEAILPQILRLLRRQDCEVMLLRIVDAGPTADFDDPINLAEEWEEAAEYLAYLSKSLSEKGVRVEVRIDKGHPADRIVEIAKEIKPGLVAMSTHGRSGIGRWIYGSVTEKILRAKLDVPILVVRSDKTKAGELRRIVVPVDGSPAALEAVGPAVELARLFEAIVIAVHVAAPELPFPLGATPEQKLSAAVQAFREAGIDAVGVLKSGDAATAILDAVREHAADLIAMTTHGRTGFTRWVLGSVAEKVLRGSTVPMLVVPAHAAKPAAAAR